MKSKSLREQYVLAEMMNSNLRGDDPRLRGAVLIHHGDGSVLFFENAFAEWHERNKANDKPGHLHDDWWYIFSEHHGVHVYADDEVKIRQYKWSDR